MYTDSKYNHPILILQTDYCTIQRVQLAHTHIQIHNIKFSNPLLYNSESLINKYAYRVQTLSQMNSANPLVCSS